MQQHSKVCYTKFQIMIIIITLLQSLISTLAIVTDGKGACLLLLAFMSGNGSNAGDPYSWYSIQDDLGSVKLRSISLDRMSASVLKPFIKLNLML